MSNEKNDNYLSYSEEGEFEILEMQCEKCLNKLSNPLICKKFHNKKPTYVLKCEEKCIEFEEKN